MSKESLIAKILQVCTAKKLPYAKGKEIYNIEPGRIYAEWDNGGYSGGNYYDGEPTPYRGDPEPEFTALDKVLEELFPLITFLQYRRLISSLVRYGQYRIDECYGNDTNYAWKAIKIESLAEFIEKEGKWLPPTST